MGKAKSLVITYLSLDLIIKTILGFFCCSIIYLMFNDRLVLKYIPINTTNLLKIGTVTSVKGDVMRKLMQDSLHLPIFTEQKIYQDDLIVTGENSSADIEIEPKNYITTEPNSAFRLRIDGKRIFIQFHNGNIITRFTEDKVINVKQGVNISQVQIRKGTYLIRNSTAGIQIVNYANRHKIKKSATVANTSEKKAQAETTDELEKVKVDEQHSEQVRLAKEQFEEKQLATPIQLPHPNDNTVFLIKTAHTLTLAAKSVCLGSCKISLLKDKKLLIEKTFNNSQVPTIDFNLDENINGHFEWSYLDREDSYNMSFDVAPFTPETFDKALQAGLPIEVY
jgi:hypothetical protein